MKLSDKVAVITGGNSGIGKAIAKALKAEGAKVAIFGRNQETLEQTQHELGGGTLAVQGDASSLADLDRLYEEVESAFGKVDIVVANAGVGKIAPFGEVTEDLFDSLVSINIKGAFFTVQKALPLMSAGGSVILTGSAAQTKGVAGMSVYGATKAAVRNLARTLAAELSAQNIRVNTISPGPIDTPIFGRIGLPKEAIQGVKDGFSSQVPLGRMAQPEEMASVALFLASSDSSYVTGSDIAADGGMAQV